MTPDELALIQADGIVVRRRSAECARSFYDTLFEIAPDTRRLFARTDLDVQRAKLIDELGFLIDAATDASHVGDLRPFLDRAHDLGRRHAGYGVTGRDYAPVGEALIAALDGVVDAWDEHHERAWRKLYRLVSDVMREGAEDQLFSAT